MNYTKGPWRAVGTKIATEHNTVIAEVLNHCNVDRPLKWQCDSPAAVENLANAQLIAAAPELLKALEELFRHCTMTHKYWGDGCNQKEADAAITAARNAIAKAKGE